MGFLWKIRGKWERGGEGRGWDRDRQRNRQVNAQALSKLPFSDLPFSFSPKTDRDLSCSGASRNTGRDDLINHSGIVVGRRLVVNGRSTSKPALKLKVQVSCALNSATKMAGRPGHWSEPGEYNILFLGSVLAISSQDSSALGYRKFTQKGAMTISPFAAREGTSAPQWTDSANDFLSNLRAHDPLKQGVFEANRTRKLTRKFSKVFVAQVLWGTLSVPV